MKWSVPIALAVCAVTLVGCGSSDDNDAAIQSAEKRQQAIEQQLERQGQQAKQALRQAERRAASAKRQAQKARQAAQAEAEAPPPPPPPPPEPEPAPASDCDPNYSGACLDPNASDYDCEGGTGDGPEYTGPVTVVGSDPYDLDSDGDGSACE